MNWMYIERGKASREGGMCGGGHLVGKYMSVMGMIRTFQFGTRTWYEPRGHNAFYEEIVFKKIINKVFAFNRVMGEKEFLKYA
jgi:hypothetical protein